METGERMKIGDIVSVYLEGSIGSHVMGEIISMTPEIRLRNAVGNEASIYPSRDEIKVLTDGEVFLYKLENA
jgi:hypothetical protein